MSKKRSLNENSKTVFLIISIILSVVLIIFGFTLLLNFSNELSQEAAVNARYYAGEASGAYESAVTSFISRTDVISERAVFGLSEEAEEERGDLVFLESIRDVIAQENFSDVLNVRYFKDGAEYNLTGNDYSTENEAKDVLTLVEEGKSGFAGLIQDKEYSNDTVCFVSPVTDCDFADAIAVFYKPDSFFAFAENIPEEATSSAVLLTLVSDDQEIFAIAANKEEKATLHQNAFNVVSEITLDDTAAKEAKTLAGGKESGSVKSGVGSNTYIISVVPMAGDCEGLSIVALYRAEDIHTTGYNSYKVILTFNLVLLVLILGVMIYLISTRNAIKKKIDSIGETDNRLEAPTKAKFEKTAGEIISQNKASSFAIVVLEVKHSDYIGEHYGDTALLELLVYLKMFCEKNIQNSEYYGYLGSGTYVLLLHYREMNVLASRLKLMYNHAMEYKMASAPSYRIQIVGGIYEVGRGYTNNISKMIGFATDAKDSLISDGVMGAFKFYNENIQNNRVQNEYVEVHMEEALANNDFKVFFQPKLNLATGALDGSESLVRWLNSETGNYMVPATFLPLFESNGFIVKLDHYVYEQVCMYVESAMMSGKPVAPINVNVSGVTASQSDFIPYYVNMKNKYHIPDGFIWLEFSESFAYENYRNLYEIVQDLHAAGFKCTIDDFGAGYSSYNVLKQLPVDEIKLDRFFIGKGISTERDNKVLASAIKVARELGLKVTQEGVETEEQKQLLRNMGCNVIQGYNYSKPLAMTDFAVFMDNHANDSGVIVTIKDPLEEDVQADVQADAE